VIVFRPFFKEGSISLMERISFPADIPYTAQIATRELAWEIFEQGLNPALDPGWAASGAKSAQEYAYWVMRACGIACVKMCAEGFARTKYSMMDWIQRGLDINGYLVVEENGKRVERGWIHKSLAALLQQEDLEASAVPADLSEILQSLKKGCLLIASVSYELGTMRPVTRKGGHLVVVRGIELHQSRPETVFINNPSGRTRELQENAAIPIERFLQAYTGRVIRVCG
jgi:hypothetical protein